MLLTETLEACLNHSTFDTVQACLEQRGWNKIGAGYFSTAYTKGDRVVKVSRKDEADWAWVDFMDFVIGNGEDFALFPKVYGLAVTQHYSIGELEKLEPIGKSICDPDGPTGYIIWKGGQPKAEERWQPFYKMVLSDSKHIPITRIAENLADTNQQHHALPFWMFRQICDLNRKRTDFHKGNIMMRWKKDRRDYDLVITDPFCHGNHAELSKKRSEYYTEVECKCNGCRMVHRSKTFNPATVAPNIEAKRMQDKPAIFPKGFYPWSNQFADMPANPSFFKRQHAAVMSIPKAIRSAMDRANKKACYDMLKFQIGMNKDAAVIIGIDECKPTKKRTKRWWFFGEGGHIGRS